VGFGGTELKVDESTQEPPHSFDETYAEGCRLFQAGQFEAAVEAFSRATALRPDDFRPWEMTGCSLGGLARWEDCLAAFDRSRQLGHECHHCWYNRSIALCQLRRADEALQALDRSLALGPNNPAAWYDRGLILGMAWGRLDREAELFDGRHEQAVAAFDRALALEPEHFGAWYCKAYTLYKISHSLFASQRLIATGASPDVAQQALACAEQALKIRPASQDAQSLKEDILAWIAEGA
jgi:tetratricopeptide (TPR) repeat protein